MNKYEKIANEMRKRIKSSVYDIDQPIPDEKTLARSLGATG